ncbi:MAG TPA: methylmalonyl-CoA mutase family protein [Ohtaekwangia sp.]|nr:methylmalonyl-CoA mutase family protein [Ohtaekwangia sp.]
MKEDNSVFNSFKKAQKQDWIKAASAELKGADPFETLQWKTEDEQVIAPFHMADDVAAIAYLKHYQHHNFAHPSDTRYWANMPEISFNDEKTGNAIALHHLQAEADGIVLSPEKQELDFDVLLHNIAWEHCSVSFMTGPHFPFEKLYDYIQQKGYAVDQINGAIFQQENNLVTNGFATLKNFKFAGSIIPSSTPVQEITQAILAGVNRIEAYHQSGILPGVLIKHIAFNIPLGTYLLPDISKLKALRILWYQVSQAYGVKDYHPNDLYIHGRSEPWINNQYQPHGNMLKSTMASIAGIAGGCDALTIHPEDDSSSMMNRVARNISPILREESHLNKVSDPFAGSYSIEILTDQIARDAWRNFQSLC